MTACDPALDLMGALEARGGVVTALDALAGEGGLCHDHDRGRRPWLQRRRRWWLGRAGAGGGCGCRKLGRGL